jgi:hypothetical protein
LAPSEVEIAASQNIPPNPLPTGTRLIEDRATSGHGELEAINGTRYDAFLIVVDASNEKRVREVSINAHDAYTLDRLDRGSYTILFATGFVWNKLTEEFIKEGSYYEFGKTLEFEETNEGNSIHYEHHTITLHPVPLGNVRSKSLTVAEFHALSRRMY